MKSFGKSLIILEKRLDSLLFIYIIWFLGYFFFFLKIEYLDIPIQMLNYKPFDERAVCNHNCI